jgi:hypothetical protein
MLRRFTTITLLALILVVPLAINAQEETETAPINELSIFDDFYNHEDGWHVLIPPGFVNESTADYARFTSDNAAITVIGSTATDAEAAIREAVAIALPDGNALPEPFYASQASLLNGTWTQQLYRVETGFIAAYAQVFEDKSYALVHVSADTLPIIVTAADETPESLAVARNTAAALYDPTISPEPLQTVALDVDSVEYTYSASTFDNADGETITVVSRERGSTLSSIFGAADVISLLEGSVVFNLLSDFFITPYTTPYLWLGFAVAFGLLFLSIVSMIVRYRNAQKDAVTLAELEAETV